MNRRWLRTLDPRIQKLIKRAKRQGWEVAATKNMHVKLASPDGHEAVFTSGHGSEAYRTTLTRMKALGYSDD